MAKPQSFVTYSIVLILHYIIVVGRLKNIPQKYQLLTHETCKYYTIWKECLCGGFEGSCDDSGLSGWAFNVITRVLIRGKQGDI